jgi:hypothetical protein
MVAIVINKPLAESEINQKYFGRVILANHEVFLFYIVMNKAQLVQSFNSFNHLDGYFVAGRLGHRTLFDDVINQLP